MCIVLTLHRSFPMSSDQSEPTNEAESASSYSANHLKHGIGIWVAALFLLGAMAGAGIVAMPNAFLNAGWWAVAMVIVMSMVGCLTGLQLSWSWSILVETWPEEYEATQTRNPYPEIAFKAGGKFWKYAVQACVHCSMFGAAIAFLILSSQNISRLLHDWFDLSINFCSMVVIISLILLPVLFLGTPKDFWPIAVGAIAATALAIFFIMIGTLIDMKPCSGKVDYPQPSVTGFISAYCTICFAYGGHAAFPTIQHDMKQHAKFPISVLASFIGELFP
uniref:Amino acid transporter transmembrane domain-containing protein n=1 Tax=Romanomermis culicivorax TaxID=13658 RepID=A0A915JEX6_ROMCU